jgi:ethanolamine utilization protein EutS
LQEHINFEEKQRIIQEFVPGKQVTLAHVIAQPVLDIYARLGLEESGAIGIVTLTPGETAIIAADIATKAATVSIGFLDRFSGSLVISGDVSSVDTALREINRVLETILGYTPCKITKS